MCDVEIEGGEEKKHKITGGGKRSQIEAEREGVWWGLWLPLLTAIDFL